MCDVERTKILSDAKSMTIHSGNVLYKLVMSVDEICASFCSQIKSWLNDKQVITNSEDIFIGEKFPGDTEDRKEIKITVKVFLHDLNPLSLQEAIDTVLKSSKISYIDSVLLSLPSNVADSNFQSYNFKLIQEVWRRLEEYVQQDQVKEIGVCDFDAESLVDLCKSAVIKPSINQVNLDQCCTPPDPLASYAAEYDVMLLTHNDPRVILPQKTVDCILCGTNISGHWMPDYLIRYTCVVKLREIVKCRGYLVKLTKET